MAVTEIGGMFGEMAASCSASSAVRKKVRGRGGSQEPGLGVRSGLLPGTVGWLWSSLSIHSPVRAQVARPADLAAGCKQQCCCLPVISAEFNLSSAEGAAQRGANLAYDARTGVAESPPDAHSRTPGGTSGRCSNRMASQNDGGCRVTVAAVAECRRSRRLIFRSTVPVQCSDANSIRCVESARNW